MEEVYTILLLEIRIGKDTRKVKHIDILFTKYMQIFSFNSERSQRSSDIYVSHEECAWVPTTYHPCYRDMESHSI